MARRFFFMPALLSLILAACTTYWDPEQEEANIISPGNFTAGSGEIYQVGVLPNANKDKGGDAQTLSDMERRIAGLTPLAAALKADNFMAGQFVELTNDGRVVRISGTTLNDALKKR